MRTKHIILALIFMVGICSCSGKMTPLQSSILNNPNIEQDYKDAIRQKRVIPGMTHNMVEASRGPAHLINYASFEDGTQAEVWVYKPSMANQYFSAKYGLSTQYLNVAFKDKKVVIVFNDIHVPNVIAIPTRTSY